MTLSEHWELFREWLADLVIGFVCLLLAVEAPIEAKCCDCMEPVIDDADSVLRCKSCDTGRPGAA